MFFRSPILGRAFALVLAPLTFVACGGDDPDISIGGTTTVASSSGSGSGNGGGGVGGGDGNGGTGTGGGSGGGGVVMGDPIVAPAETWTWVPFDDAFCGSGQTTGIGINLTDKSKNVVIFMMGGGACWDNFTCYQAQTASNLNGYTETKFKSDTASLLDSASLFDRTDATNPTKDYSYVFVPYCTGDVHAGNNVADYNGKKTSHVGFANMTAYLKRVTATFPDATRVLLTGSSAGGFGAGVNWWQTAKAFPKARVDMLDDCGPILPNSNKSLIDKWRASWGLDANLPAECTECATKLEAIFPFYDANLPGSRAGLLAYTHDNVIASFFFPLDNMGQNKVAIGVDQLATSTASLKNFRHFYVDSTQHVMLDDPASVSQSGVQLKDWIVQMLSDDPKWDNVQP